MKVLCSWALLCQERSEKIAHGRSFVKSYLWSLFFKEQREWITKSRSLIWAILSKRAKEQILNPGFESTLKTDSISAYDDLKQIQSPPVTVIQTGLNLHFATGGRMVGEGVGGGGERGGGGGGGRELREEGGGGSE